MLGAQLFISRTKTIKNSDHTDFCRKKLKTSKYKVRHSFSTPETGPRLQSVSFRHFFLNTESRFLILAFRVVGFFSQVRSLLGLSHSQREREASYHGQQGIHERWEVWEVWVEGEAHSHGENFWDTWVSSV